MATYRVTFDGNCQDFDELGSALEWARLMGKRGRIVHVAMWRGPSLDLVTVFPESRAREGTRMWHGSRSRGLTAPTSRAHGVRRWALLGSNQ
jgi:hypothetical protein